LRLRGPSRALLRGLWILLLALPSPARADDTPLSSNLRSAFAAATGVPASIVTEAAEHPIGRLWASTGLHSILVGAWDTADGSVGAVALTRRCGDGRCLARLLPLGPCLHPAVVALVDLEGEGGELVEADWEQVYEPARDRTDARPALLLRMYRAAPPPSKERRTELRLYPLLHRSPVWVFDARIHDGTRSTTRYAALTFVGGPLGRVEIQVDDLRFGWIDGKLRPLRAQDTGT
jgi:hypothetical protein